LSSDNNYINHSWQSRFEEIPITAVSVKNATVRADTVRMMKAAMANGIPSGLGVHLRFFYSVPVFVLAPVSGAA
jgi:hypothetical protein